VYLLRANVCTKMGHAYDLSSAPVNVHASKGRAWSKCQCPIWVQGRLGDDHIREGLDIRSWEAAQQYVRDWEAKGTMQEDVKRVTVADASEKFIRELRSRQVTPAVIRKSEILLQERLAAFCKQKGHPLTVSKERKARPKLKRRFGD
jgi:hypothetical protein